MARNPVLRPKDATKRGAAVLSICAVLVACSAVERRNVDEDRPTDTRVAIHLSASAQHEHRAVMLQHLETVQMIVHALAEENYDLAKGLTDSHLGFFRHRELMVRQQPENFPPPYHDLALAHHEAAEQLARIIPTKDLKQILPQFDNLLKTCVACHLEYKVKANS
jgi:Na+-transporting methylmalonyl-CoA/oxaloacetate decarboxylase gamma subunit